jgi:protein disulfide-isomerase A1
MEATENDLPPTVPFKVSGFPTLKFKPAGSRDFVDYEGDRSFESLVSFVEEHAKNSLEIPVIATQKDEAQTPLKEEEKNATKHDEL